MLSKWITIIAGALLFMTTACGSPERQGTGETPQASTSTAIAFGETNTSTATGAAATRTPTLSPTNTRRSQPEPSPTPRLTATPDAPPPLPEGWRYFGNERYGLRVAAPDTWLDMTAPLRAADDYESYWPRLLLLVDSEATAEQLFSGELPDPGAYVFAFLSELEATGGALVNLESLLDGVASNGEQSVEPEAITINGRPGFMVDLPGDPLDLFPLIEAPLQSRLLVLVGPGDETAATILMASGAENWPAHMETLSGVMGSIVMPESSANVFGHLSSGDLVRNALELEYSDIWTFNGEAGQYATIGLTPVESSIDMTLSLIDPSGNILITTDGGYAGDPEVLTDILLPESGTYIIEASEFFNETGRYALSLFLADEPQFGGGGFIEFGQEVTSELAEDGEQIWIFNGTADQDVTIIVTSLDDQLDVILELRGPDGRELVTKDESFAGDAEVLTGFELTVTGEHAIIVHGFAGRGGAYSLSLDEGGESTVNFYDAGDLAYGDNKREFLRDDEAHAWFFNGRAGDEVTINVTPLETNMDMDIWLLDPELDELTMKDEYSSGEAEKIEYTLPADGQYLVLVREFFGDPGEYQILLDVSEEEVLSLAGTIRFGQTITATLLQGKSTGWSFDGQAGDVVNIVLTSVGPERDLVLDLVSPSGEIVISMDAALSGLPEELLGYELPNGGRWMIVIREFFNDGSQYKLSLDRGQ